MVTRLPGSFVADDFLILSRLMKIGFLLKKSIFYYLFSIEIQNENIDRVVLEVTSQLIMFEGQRLATI